MAYAVWQTIDCILTGLQKIPCKQANYQKLQEQTQCANENPTEFLTHLTETLTKFTNVDPHSPKGTNFTNSHSISQVTANIKAKFTNSDLVHQWRGLKEAF